MSELEERFEQAVRDAQDLPSRPSDDTMLELYGLYKQATSGDATGKRPGRLNVVARAKHDAWAARAGTSRDDAMGAYVDLVDRLRAR